MTWWHLVGLALLIIVIGFAIFRERIRGRAGRLESEMIRTGAVLEQSLRGRALAARDLARSRFVDPATALLLEDLTARCLGDLFDEDSAMTAAELRTRALPESELTQGLRVILPALSDTAAAEPTLAALVALVNSQWDRAAIARTVHNSRVIQATELHESLSGWWAGLDQPSFVPFDVDDARNQP